MVWVDAAQDLEGGGTEFPYLRRRGVSKVWCRWVECAASTSSGGSDSSSSHEEKAKDPHEDGEDMGLIFKPAPGNAVFWENFRPDGTGRGWEETWHAGLPVRKGFKVGLNIWSWGRLDYQMA